MEQASVLVVDDHPPNLIAMQAALEPLDVEVVAVGGGVAALEVIAKRRFALALVDVQMPGMDGFDLATRIREVPNGDELPIVFVSAVHYDAQYIKRGYAVGAADYLTKPIDTEELHARVRAFVELFRQREHLDADLDHRTREQLALMLERERAANAAKDEFIAVASHELRTPLTSILGWIALTRTMKSGPELERAHEIVERNARAQMRLLDDLRDMTRGTRGALVLDLGDVSVDEIIETTAAALIPISNDKGVELSVECRVGSMRADGSRLRQVIANLLTNALKFTPRGGHVSVSCQRTEQALELTVRDDGEGIHPDFLPHVFEPFRQGKSSSSQKKEGLGLGLAIVKQIVEAHRGSIHAQSGGPGKGSTFTVTLPACHRASQPSNPADSHMSSAIPAAANGPR